MAIGVASNPIQALDGVSSHVWLLGMGRLDASTEGGLRQVAAVGGCPLGGDCPDPMAVAHSPRVLARIARSMLVAKGATRQGKLEGEVPT